jgi:hypothetical protein
MCNIYKHNYNQCIKSMGRTIYNANRHIYILKETFGLTEIQPLKYTSQISRFCLYFWVTVIQYKTYPISQYEALCCYHLPVWKVCIARRKYRTRNFDAFYIFTIKFSKSPARNFQPLARSVYIYILFITEYILIFISLPDPNVVQRARSFTVSNCNFEKSHTNTSRSFRRLALTLLPMASSHSPLVYLVFLRKKLAR